MKFLVAFVALSLIVFAVTSKAQSVSIPAQGMDVQTLAVPASTPATLLNLTVDASPNGGDYIDVIASNSQVVISLILPGGVEVTTANAASLGFTVSQLVNASGTPVTSGVFTPFDAIGGHTIFVLPASSPGGTYEVKANSTAVAAPSTISATYLSLSGVKVGLAKDKLVYSLGDNTVLTAFVLEGSMPAVGATVTATIVPPWSLNASAAVGNFQLTSQTTANGFTSSTYQASLTNNSGAAFSFVTAKLINLPSSITLEAGGVLGFANVPTTGTATSVNTFTIQVASGQAFDPTTLSWDMNGPGTPVTVSLLDSGPFDFAPGDGLYTGVYTPTVIGKYQVLVSVSGTYSGASFARTAAISFDVVTPLAAVSGVADAAVLNGNSLIDHLVLSAQLNVQVAGNYAFSVGLKASNGTVTIASGMASLSAGSGLISLSLPASQVLSLGVDGPYEKINAAVVYMPQTGDPVSVGFIGDAGPTAAYAIANLSRGTFYFTGQYSSTPIDNNGIPGFETLAIGIGVSQQSAGNCQANGSLYAGTTQIDSTSSSQFYSTGATSVTLNFSGYHISAAGLNGPYTLRNVTVICGSNQISGDNLFQTPAYTASQFESGTPNFGLSAPTSVNGSTSPAASIPVSINPVAGFNGPIQFTVSGVPSGSTATVYFPTIVDLPQMQVAIVSNTTVSGSYPITITGTSGSLSHSVNTTLIVSPLATPQFSPPAGNYATPQTIALTSSSLSLPLGAFIVYTTDGSIPPGPTAIPYNGPFTVSSSTSIQAITIASGQTSSSVAAATYTITPVAATPTFSPAGGTYGPAQSVTISTTTSGASIRYTTDGSTPSETAGTLYSGAITVNATTTIKAIAYESGYTDSTVASATFTFLPSAATPTFSPGAGSYSSATVTISTTTSGASIRYTTDGSTPSETAGTLYSGAITVSATTTIKAIAYESGWADSTVASATFTILPLAATPTFSPAAGTYTTAQTVTISTTTSGASIRYTTDGSTPSETAGTLYSGAITVSATTTIKAIAYETGYLDSTVASGTFTISPWYNTSWGYRKPITIDHTKVSSNLTNFPVLISLASDSNLASTAQTNGNDILFTDASGTSKLNHEIETYVSSTGQLIAWVQVPSVSPTTDTVIYMYYGNTSATNQQNGTGVWDSNYLLVEHMANDAASKVSSDSTSNGNTGTTVNNTSAMYTSGKIGGGFSFNGSSDAVTYAGVAIGTTSTISAWVNEAAVANDHNVLSQSATSGLWLSNGTINLYFGGGNHESNTVQSTGTWYYITVVQNGSGTTSYLNGAPDGSFAGLTTSFTANGTGADVGNGGDRFNGIIDELRASNIARSAGWIGTEYNNQNSPSTFFSVGSQVNSGIVATPTFSPAAGSYSSATVTISTTTSGASIRYTTDGSTPSETAGTLYSSPVTVSATTTIKAIAYESGWADSTVASATFTILPLAATPTFSPAAGTYTTAQTVTISTTTSGASIRYTTDGSTPSETAGTLYSSPVTVSSTTTLKAIAYESGYLDSTVASGTFTISPWYNTNWSDRKPITIDHTKVSGSSSLTNFPVLISLASDSNLQSTAQASGADILFTAGDGVTKLNHEIEQYTSSTGQLVAWVQVPTVSTTSDTLIYIYYGNSAASSQQNATGVWDSNYLLVEHMANDAASTVSSDSTSNGNTGTTVNNTSAMYTTGKIGGGFSFNGSSDAVTYAGVAIGTTSTISAWVNETSEATYNNVFANGGSNGLWMTSGTMNLYNGGRHQSNTTESTGTWYYITAVQGGTNITYYLNGSPDGSFSGAAFSFTANGTGRDNGGSEYFHGIMDELRASNIARSAGWIGTEYNNQNSPSTFYGIGSQQVSIL